MRVLYKELSVDRNSAAILTNNSAWKDTFSRTFVSNKRYVPDTSKIFTPINHLWPIRNNFTQTFISPHKAKWLCSEEGINAGWERLSLGSGGGKETHWVSMHSDQGRQRMRRLLLGGDGGGNDDGWEDPLSEYALGSREAFVGQWMIMAEGTNKWLCTCVKGGFCGEAVRWWCWRREGGGDDGDGGGHKQQYLSDAMLLQTRGLLNESRNNCFMSPLRGFLLYFFASALIGMPSNHVFHI
jgi:hypothetical protein